VTASKPIRLLSKQEKKELQAREEKQSERIAASNDQETQGQHEAYTYDYPGYRQEQSESAKAAQKAENMRPAALLRIPALERERPARERLVGIEAAIRGLLWTLALACVLFYLGVASWDYSYVAVPRLQGRTAEQALQILSEQGLSGDIANYRSSSSPEGEIIGQTPPQGARIQRDSTVELTVSTGVDGFEIPNLIGQDQETAQRTLERLGLHVVVQQLQTEEPAGTVLLTAPPSGTRVFDTTNPYEAQITMYVSTQVLSAGLVDFQLSGLQVAIEPRYTLTAAGDLSFDVARRLSSLFEAAGADTNITRTSREHELDQNELDSRAARLAPQLHIVLSIRNSGSTGVVVRSADDSSDSAGILIYQRLLDAQIDASFEQSETFGMAGVSNSIEIVLGNMSNAEDVNRFSETFWRDHIARAIYMAASPQFSLER